MNDRFEIRPTPGKGQGLFSRYPIARGDRVLPLQGVLLTSEELTDDLLAVQVGPDLWLASPGTTLDDYINHSCDPNIGFLTGEPILFALRDIAAGEELCWDYSTSLSEPGWRLDCCCGSPQCRKVILPWGELSETDRKRLKPIALAYLRL